MDDLDRAKELEMQHRSIALKNQQSKAQETETPLEIDGVRCCLDCYQPIQEARLKARPESVRCIDCKTYKEEMEKRYA
ncbi:MAG TPA: TraR/DksA family transcriptional regulator [Thiotrichales bacterium]|nr:TraR/DksA family transcriptional regulator [Thiotrichales bacterium]